MLFGTATYFFLTWVCSCDNLAFIPRLARTIAVGFAHHITQRGNNRYDVFFVDDDRRVYLELLKEQADTILAGTGRLLPDEQSYPYRRYPARAGFAGQGRVGRTHFCYTQYINCFHGRSGHLWQGRFYSCDPDERHFRLAMKYIELNPVRAKLCRKVVA